MPKYSAGLLLFRKAKGDIEVLLVHPGGPFWARKDQGAWSIPKGEYTPDEDSLEAARREFHEETGMDAAGPFIPLGECRQPSGKYLRAWALEQDVEARSIQSNTFSLEWPPKSGRLQEFPEVDRAGWFPLPEARTKILKGQLPFLDRLSEMLAGLK